MKNESSTTLHVMSLIKGDASRETKTVFQWAPAKSLIASLRSYQRHQNSLNPLRALLKKWAALRHRFWSIITGTDIPINCKIGVELMLPHPNGIVIHRDAIIGNNCMIMQQVTIGQLAADIAPKIGNDVYIGAGAKILGAISIGNNVSIGANSVVLIDLPDGCTAVGVPARVVRDEAKIPTS
jgi:serine O-acetyltransferase